MESEVVPSTTTHTGVTVGIIGTGNMGAALIRGWAKRLGPEARLLVWDKIPAAMERVAGCRGVVAAGSLAELVTESHFVVVVVKPKDGDELLRSLSTLFRDGQSVVSSMAGVELRQIRQACGPKPELFRVMPNLGVEAGAGMVAVSGEPGGQAAQHLQTVVELFGILGRAVVVPESVLDTVTAVSGTGPALLALALEGLEDGGVAAGLPRATARTFARQAMLGAARTLVAGGVPAHDFQQGLEAVHPVLAEGLGVLEERNVRAVFEVAVGSAARRARQMRGPSGAR